MAAPLSDPLVGQLLDGRYQITRWIARGGMATVYEAMDTRLERVVALKVMHAGLAEDRAFVDRFIREARAAARLSHPSVVAVYDQSAEAGYVFLAMEYVAGRTLREWLRDKGRLTPRETFAVLEPVLAALAAAHRAGLIHRDIKPENVLIADDGRVKVADFGLARAVAAGNETVAGHGATSTGTLIGTVAYLAPEQVERGIADQRSDVYAAGILLFECLTGTQPHSGETPLQVAYAHVHYDVPPPSTRHASVPAELDALVLRTTSRSPDLRPPDAAAFLADLVVARRALNAAELDDLAGAGSRPASRGEGAPTLVVPVPGASPDAATAQIRSGQGHLPRRAAAPQVTVPPRLANRRRRGLIALILVLLTALAVGVGAWQVAVGSSVDAPNLINLTRAEATKQAADLGLTVRFEQQTEFDETVPEGQVLRTDPAAGRKVAKNGVISAVLSGGPERFAVPALSGISVTEARNRLTEGNLSPGEVREVFSDNVDEGLVIKTEPAAGTEQRRDTVVDLVVSRGSRPVEVPELVGFSLEEAGEILTDLGLELGEVTAADDDLIDDADAEPGQVLAQRPEPGESAERGDSVDLVVAPVPAIATVPNVVGMDLDEARDVLDELGYEVRVAGFGSLFGGEVIAQDPPGGTEAPEGTTVTLQTSGRPGRGNDD
ncbi:MAG: Stk1 family PASTA domain-containing Ser/Thr kinase [Sporichthyaceae bacterium]